MAATALPALPLPLALHAYQDTLSPVDPASEIAQQIARPAHLPRFVLPAMKATTVTLATNARAVVLTANSVQEHRLAHHASQVTHSPVVPAISSALLTAKVAPPLTSAPLATLAITKIPAISVSHAPQAAPLAHQQPPAPHVPLVIPSRMESARLPVCRIARPAQPPTRATFAIPAILRALPQAVRLAHRTVPPALPPPLVPPVIPVTQFPHQQNFVLLLAPQTATHALWLIRVQLVNPGISLIALLSAKPAPRRVRPVLRRRLAPLAFLAISFQARNALLLADRTAMPARLLAPAARVSLDII